jgi:LPS export ABC transporter permease LptG/LPS export ABC transporter permease LptF
MRLLSRNIFIELAGAAALGTVLFTFVLFLQKLGAGKFFEILVRGSATPATVAYLFALVLPAALTFAIPVGTLVGVLIGLGRMSSDGEIVAMRAAGVPSRRVFVPALALGLLATTAAASATLWLTPWSIRETVRVLNDVIAKQLTAEVQPRVFEEQFTDSNTILYVGDVVPEAPPTAKWRNVFIADVRPPEERGGDADALSDVPKITVASEAIAVPDPEDNSIQLHLTGVSTHEVESDPSKAINTASPSGDQRLRARERTEFSVKAWVAQDTRQLLREAVDSAEARIELHQRFALPVACLLLAILGIPIGVSSRKGGKSTAFVLTVFLAFLYYMGLISLIGLAKQERLPVVLAVWTPNVVFALAGIVLFARLERPGDRDWLEVLRAAAGHWWNRGRELLHRAPVARGSGFAFRFPLLPGLVDAYVLNTFLFYFLVLLASFVMMAHTFIFFELLSDIFSHGIAWNRVLTYHLFLTPKLIYDSAPMSVLVAVLVTFGILAKHNEITAMKACGVSLYRLAIPILLVSGMLSAGLFAFDHYYIPEANRIQDGILNEIKGRPVQTYLRPERKWIFGQGSRIYYYKYFDAAQNLMIGVNVYELAPETFRLRRHISAESARWAPSMNQWIFQNGWVRDFDGVAAVRYETYQATTFPDLSEPPGWFLKEVKQEKQLNFKELAGYIRELEQSGFDTVRLKVQFHKKFAVPVFALIMALISAPFAFLTGNKGALAPVGLSFGIAIAYWAFSRLFEEIGNLDQLPPALAAWSPDVLFTFAGLYLFTRMRS